MMDTLSHLDNTVLDLISNKDVIGIQKFLTESTTNIDLCTRMYLEFICKDARGQYEEATQLILESIEKNIFIVQSMGSLLYILDVFSRVGKYRQALTLVRMAKKKGYSGWQLEVQEARFLALNREFEKSLTGIRSVWPKIPAADRREVGIFEARLLYILGRHEQALEKFKIYLKRPNGKPWLYDRTAKLAFDSGDLKIAHYYAFLSVQIFGGSVNRYIFIAEILRDQGNHRAVIVNANLAINILEINKTFKIGELRYCRELIIESRLSLRQFDFALNELIKHVDEDPDWMRGRALMVECYLALQLRANAEQVLADLLEVAPTDPDVMAAQHMLNAQFGNYETASSALHALTTDCAEDSRTRQFLARMNGIIESNPEREIGNIEMPREFLPRWTDHDLRSGSTIWHGLKGHLRSAMALLLRESRTRFVRHRLGILWAFLEPAVHTGLFVLVFIAVGRHSLYGMSVPLFLITGLIPYQLFFGSYQQMLSAVSGNKSLFMHPKVQVLDVVVARSMLETGVILLVFIFFLLGLIFFGEKLYIGDLLVVLLGFIGLLCCGVGLGLITAGIKIVLPGMATIINHSIKLLFFTSGVFFAPEMFSPDIRDIMLLNPLLHYIGMIRSNFSPILGYQNVDFIYAFIWGLGLLTVGFMYERLFRFRLLSQ